MENNVIQKVIAEDSYLNHSVDEHEPTCETDESRGTKHTKAAGNVNPKGSNNIGNQIATYRKKVRLRQYELATLVNISPSYLSQIEKGTKTPNVDLLEEICNVLDAPFILLLLESMKLSNHESHVIRRIAKKIAEIAEICIEEDEKLPTSVAGGGEMLR